MSTTAPTPADGYISPQRAFDRVVWHNSRACNGCFEHVREIGEATFSGGVFDHDVEDRHRTPQASLEQGVVDHDTHGEITSTPPMTTCRTCARVGCWADDDTLSKTQALRLTTPLARRLEEAGIEFDAHALRRAVRLFKERNDVQGRDTEIFRRSVKLAVQRG